MCRAFLREEKNHRVFHQEALLKRKYFRMRLGNNCLNSSSSESQPEAAEGHQYVEDFVATSDFLMFGGCSWGGVTGVLPAGRFRNVLRPRGRSTNDASKAG